MEGTENICVICAWRETCQKKFSVSGKDARCADFTKDLSIKGQGEAPPPEEEKKEG